MTNTDLARSARSRGAGPGTFPFSSCSLSSAVSRCISARPKRYTPYTVQYTTRVRAAAGCLTKGFTFQATTVSPPVRCEILFHCALLSLAYVSSVTNKVNLLCEL